MLVGLARYPNTKIWDNLYSLTEIMSDLYSYKFGTYYIKYIIMKRFRIVARQTYLNCGVSVLIFKAFIQTFCLERYVPLWESLAELELLAAGSFSELRFNDFFKLISFFAVFVALIPFSMDVLRDLNADKGFLSSL